MADDKEKLIEQFCLISGVDADRSRFYLESAAWNIETALGSLYEEPEESSQSQGPEKKSTSTEKGLDMPKVTMLDSGDSSSEDEGQAFYAGGSEHSGQQVLGPPKKKKDVVSMLFKSAKDHGAEVLESKEKGGKQKKLTFAGTGYRLGETESDHEAIPGASNKSDQPKDVTLRMWKTGFTVDSGPLREYDDPDNHEFLNSVRRGQVPMELVRSARGGEVYINMEDHRHVDFIPPKSSVAAFSGEGHTLGSPAPSVLGQVTNTGMPGGATGRTVITSSKGNPDLTSLEESARHQLNIDSGQPTTNIQLRLPDGSRLILKMNHSQTVGDIRLYASTARPQLPSSFAIMTTFPHAELTDDSQTLVEANLLNAALVLK